MYSFIESDERVNLVLNFLDEAIAGLDSMESQVSSYKIHLNVGRMSVGIDCCSFNVVFRP